MTQVTLAVVAKGGWSNQDGSLDTAALRKAVEDYHVGSILNVQRMQLMLIHGAVPLHKCRMQQKIHV
jgi:hypothetical protein